MRVIAAVLLVVPSPDGASSSCIWTPSILLHLKPEFSLLWSPVKPLYKYPAVGMVFLRFSKKNTGKGSHYLRLMICHNICSSRVCIMLHNVTFFSVFFWLELVVYAPAVPGWGPGKCSHLIFGLCFTPTPGEVPDVW